MFKNDKRLASKFSFVLMAGILTWWQTSQSDSNIQSAELKSIEKAQEPIYGTTVQKNDTLSPLEESKARAQSRIRN
ncbi:MAG: hypothetical protein KDD50_01440 [Bdellovibrionales bacterium]|nr:hypothetical protein [Bdellovibrionales bacterium]MCB0412964.1 hypothetical protein [Bdellovibrionales bacterium]